MKKILLTSALILSIAGLAPASVLGEENTTQSTSAIKEAVAKEEKKDSIVKEKTESETLPKVDVQEGKTKKEGWYQENHHWRFYQDDKPALNWKQIQGKCTTSIKMVIVFILLSTKAMPLTKMVS